MDTIITILTTLLASVAFAIAASVLGCLLAGLDRKITARMQGRVRTPDPAALLRRTKTVHEGERRR